MKTGFVVLVIAALCMLATAADPPATQGFPHKTGEEVLVNLQGENHDFWVVSFFQPGDNNDEVRDQIKQAMDKDFKGEVYKYGEVPLTAGYEYQKLFETLELTGEPKRGHTTPQVLVMKDGEGYIIYGPQIGKAVAKRYAEVRDGGVFKAKTTA